jgi:hypothetical protein
MGMEAQIARTKNPAHVGPGFPLNSALEEQFQTQLQDASIVSCRGVQEVVL